MEGVSLKTIKENTRKHFLFSLFLIPIAALPPPPEKIGSIAFFVNI